MRPLDSLQKPASTVPSYSWTTPGTLSSLSLLLRHRGVTVYEASTGSGAVRSALAHRPDVLVLDNRLGNPEDMTGIDVIDALHAQSFYPTWILYSGFMEFEIAADAGRRNVFSVIQLGSPSVDDAVMEALTATRRGQAGGWPSLPVGTPPTSPTNPTKGAAWILVACDAPVDLTNFPEWASFAATSERRMRDLFKQLALDPQQVKCFMRVFRALAITRGHMGDAIAELSVADARTLKHLIDESGLSLRSVVRIPLEQFLRSQRFVPIDHAVLTALRSLIAIRSRAGLFKP
jgi:CheY-like chemotaxis protein